MTDKLRNLAIPRPNNVSAGTSASTKTSTGAMAPITFLQDTPPAPGAATAIAAGIWAIRLPIELSMDHVNVYLLENTDGWTLVDTGTNTDNCKHALLSVLNAPPFADKPVTQVIATHFHPDHIGLAGYFTSGQHHDHKAELLTSRTSWQTSQLLVNDPAPVPHPEQIEFVQRMGMTGMDLESFRRRQPTSYAQTVLPMPRAYTRLKHGDRLSINNRIWSVYEGNGHADEHLVLWSDDNIAIVGDQILPTISPNLSVHYSEAAADTVGQWIDACGMFQQLLNDETLCLPGHSRCFTGAPRRCAQLLENCTQVISRIGHSLTKPKTGFDLMPDIYKRELKASERNALVGETMGYLNHMLYSGKIKRRLNRKGIYLWHAIK